MHLLHCLPPGVFALTDSIASHKSTVSATCTQMGVNILAPKSQTFHMPVKSQTRVVPLNIMILYASPKIMDSGDGNQYNSLCVHLFGRHTHMLKLNTSLFFLQTALLHLLTFCSLWLTQQTTHLHHSLPITAASDLLIIQYTGL
jgi:hypothetical protein